jgi:hypothetical protein
MTPAAGLPAWPPAQSVGLRASCMASMASVASGLDRVEIMEAWFADGRLKIRIGLGLTGLMFDGVVSRVWDVLPPT